MTPRAHREDYEQRNLFAWLELAYPEAFRLTIHVPNGGKRNRIEAARFKGMGVKAGVPDVLCFLPAQGCTGLAIEMKAAHPHASTVTKAQAAWLQALQACGWRAEVCHGFDEARAVFRDYLTVVAS